MKKVLGGLFLVLVIFSVFDPLKHIGLRQLSNVEREVVFFKTFSIEEYLNKEYNNLTADTFTENRVTKKITGEIADIKSKELLNYFNDLELKEWKGPFDDPKNFNGYVIIMSISYNESIWIDIRSENHINIIVEVPTDEDHSDYHDWHYKVVDGIDMKYIDSFVESLTE